MAKNVKKSDYTSDKNSNVEIKKTRFERELIKSSKKIQEGKATFLNNTCSLLLIRRRKK